MRMTTNSATMVFTALLDSLIHRGKEMIETLNKNPATLNVIEMVLEVIRLSPSKKRTNKILRDVSGIVRPSRMTLLLGPPLSCLDNEVESNRLKLHLLIFYVSPVN